MILKATEKRLQEQNSVEVSGIAWMAKLATEISYSAEEQRLILILTEAALLGGSFLFVCFCFCCYNYRAWSSQFCLKLSAQCIQLNSDNLIRPVRGELGGREEFNQDLEQGKEHKQNK